MKIAVLACGPSLVRHFNPQRERFDLVIAVNSAGWLYACDWLAFSDRHIIHPILDGNYDKPRVGLLTNTGWKADAIDAGLEWRPLPLYDYRLGNLTPAMAGLCIEAGMTECGFTFPNALFFAGTFNPREVHVFGFDCAMTVEDVAGVKGYHTRKRWLTELPWIKEAMPKGAFLRCECHDLIKGWLSGLHGWELVQDIFADRPEWEGAP